MVVAGYILGTISLALLLTVMGFLAAAARSRP
jgi:hypothetical protein